MRMEAEKRPVRRSIAWVSDFLLTDTETQLGLLAIWERVLMMLALSLPSSRTDSRKRP